jgi:hypothetical protein
VNADAVTAASSSSHAIAQALKRDARIVHDGLDFRSIGSLKAPGGEPRFKYVKHFLCGPLLVTNATLPG